MNFLKNKSVPENLIPAIREREMAIEHSINRFRASFLIVIAILDTISSLLIKELQYSTGYEILGGIISSIGITFILIIHFTTKKGKKYRGFIKYISITLDLSITIAFSFGVLFLMDFPIPIAKETFGLLVTIMLVFFNTLSVLRTDKRIVIYSGILTVLFNAALLISIDLGTENNVNMLVGYSTFFIIILSIFNLWVSDQILQSFLANKELALANNEIEQKNEELNQLVEEISSQRDEIEAQRDTVEQQKQHIEIIHNEVEQSIDYAMRLQQSILPDEKLLAKYISDYFVFFRPKDKVSGDFYWWAHIENYTIITAADCTGHGVPGAFMSMLGTSFLREIVQKEYVTHTGVILRKLRKEIIKALKQKGESGEQKDGMDMAIISINHETNTVQFSGANNPLYIVKSEEETVIARRNDEAISTNNEQIATPSARNDDKNKQIASGLTLAMTNNDYGLYEIKPDKMPIAIYEKMDNFTAHEIYIEKGDQLYLFSDGFADQFGGPKGKKFKYKPFKQLIINNCQLTMTEQKEIFEKTFNGWVQGYEQIDDVTIMGIKL